MRSDEATDNKIDSWEMPVAITHKRPDWMKNGIVIAGNWSSLMARTQRIKQCYTQTGYDLSDEEAEACYREEMSPAMADRLKELGTVTLVILPMWSGMGSYEDELPGMEDTRRFAELLHDRGFKVGVYIHNMNLSRGFLAARPDTYDWLAWPAPKTPFAQPPPPETESEGYPVYRNHPEYLKFMFGLVDYSINEVKADFLHFDNYVNTTGFSPQAIDDFRAFLRMKYTHEELREHFGLENLDDVGVLAHNEIAPISLEWQYFQGWALATSYRKLANYARSLNPQIATDVNASGMPVGFRRPINLSILIPHGDAFWDEQASTGWDPEKRLLKTAIRTYKLGRLFHQSAFLYTQPGITMCQAMTFNYDSLGCPYWFLYARLRYFLDADIQRMGSVEEQFYHEHRDVFAEGETIADVAVLRGSAVNLCGPQEACNHAYLFEQALITHHIPFEIIFDQHLNDLTRYKAVVLPDVRMLEDDQIDQLLHYVEEGGGLLITDETAEQDSRGAPRRDYLKRFFREPVNESSENSEQRGRGRIAYTRVQSPATFEDGCLPMNGQQLIEAIRRVMGDPTFRTDASPWVCMEFVRQQNRRIIHLLDYSESKTTSPIRIRIDGVPGKVEKTQLLSPYKETQTLTVEEESASLRIDVPEFHLYAVVVMDVENYG